MLVKVFLDGMMLVDTATVLNPSLKSQRKEDSSDDDKRAKKKDSDEGRTSLLTRVSYITYFLETAKLTTEEMLQW